MGSGYGVKPVTVCFELVLLQADAQQVSGHWRRFMKNPQGYIRLSEPAGKLPDVFFIEGYGVIFLKGMRTK